MTQKEAILEMLRNATMRTVTCRELADKFLYHKAASRVSELNDLGFEIVHIPGRHPMAGKYTMLFDKDRDKVNVITEPDGQMAFTQ